MNDVHLFHTPHWRLDGDQWFMVVGNRTVAKIIPSIIPQKPAKESRPVSRKPAFPSP